MRIERMKERDIEKVSELVTDAFYDKLTVKAELSKYKVQTILKLLWIQEAEQYGMTVCTVWQDNTIVGAFGVTKRQENGFSLRLLAKTLAVINHIGLKSFLCFMQAALETSHLPQIGEVYIDFIAVGQAFQNQGIGHFIMNQLAERSEQDGRLRKLTLFVLKGNNRAIHLYEKMGYKKTGNNRSEKYHFMVKRIR